jgi:hypothetical protein
MITDLLLLVRKLPLKQQPKQKQKKNLIGSLMPMPLMTKKSKVRWVMVMMRSYQTQDLPLLVVSGLIIQLLLTNTLAP